MLYLSQHIRRCETSEIWQIRLCVFIFILFVFASLQIPLPNCGHISFRNYFNETCFTYTHTRALQCDVFRMGKYLHPFSYCIESVVLSFILLPKLRSHQCLFRASSTSLSPFFKIMYFFLACSLLFLLVFCLLCVYVKASPYITFYM